MNKLITIAVLLIFIFIGSLISGQEPLYHPANFYRSEDGKLYINRNQPMYLFLGSTPDANSDLQRLNSESSSKYSNPFYFDSDGYNSIRTPWRVDTVTKELAYPLEDIIFEVYADGTPPATKVFFTGATKFSQINQAYYGPGLFVEFNATDATSGVNQTYYSINGQDFVPYSGPLELTEEDNYTLKYYSVDNVGNVEDISQQSFIIDTTPPVGSWTLEGDVFENTASGNSKIVIMGQDALSGIKEVRYQINDLPVRTYREGIRLSDLPSNEYNLNYWIEDNVGNIFSGSDGGVNVVQTFVVDQSVPSTSAAILGDQYEDRYLYVSPRSSCQLDAIDSISGIRNIIYGFNNRRIMNDIYEEPFSFKDTKGIQTIYFQAFDRVANKSIVEELKVYMDNEAPISRINYSGPQFFTRDTLFISSETIVNLISEDDASGVQSVAYRINDGHFQTGKEFSLKDPGFHKIGFRATDNVNNQETEKISELYVDNEPPEIYVNFSIQAIREETINGETYKVYPPYVRMYIGATDKHCGTQDIFYSVDGGETVKYTGINSSADQDIFKEEKTYDVLVEATDKLGNRSNRNIRFKISNQ